MKYFELDTPSLLINREKMLDNLKNMQDFANNNGVDLRPHTKTHKMPSIALIQEGLGAKGITVAKVEEAETMASRGLNNIFIANEIVGIQKLEKILELSKKIDISFGIDSIEQVEQISEVFKGSPARILVEIEVGENRSGVIEEDFYKSLLMEIKARSELQFVGVFSHDGHSYIAKDQDDCVEISLESQRRTLRFAEIAENMGMKPQVISIGSTPSMLVNTPILPGVTEIRPGTYVFLDASQANIIGSYERNAATVLTTIISKPTSERVVTDVGAKGLTMQRRTIGITATEGLGAVKDFEGVYISRVYDEHALIYSKDFREKISIGDKIEIIPNHICPVINLYDKAYLISGDEVVEELAIECRGKLR